MPQVRSLRSYALVGRGPIANTWLPETAPGGIASPSGSRRIVTGAQYIPDRVFSYVDDADLFAAREDARPPTSGSYQGSVPYGTATGHFLRPFFRSFQHELDLAMGQRLLDPSVAHFQFAPYSVSLLSAE